MRSRLRARLPSQNQVFLVFSVIVFVVFSWTLIREFFQVPSWMKYMNLGDILVITAYILAFALFESLLVLGFLLMLSVVFPVKIFRDYFIAQGCTLVSVAGLGAVMLQENIRLVYHGTNLLSSFHFTGYCDPGICAGICIRSPELPSAPHRDDC